RHPADYVIHALVAERLLREHHPATLHWVNDAMYLNPTHPAPHLMAATVLAETGHKAQALVEYREAVAGSNTPREAWETVTHHWPPLENLIAATPDETRYLAALAKWLVNAHGRYDDADRVHQLILDRDPQNVGALSHLAQRAIERGDAAAARTRVD